MSNSLRRLVWIEIIVLVTWRPNASLWFETDAEEELRMLHVHRQCLWALQQMHSSIDWLGLRDAESETRWQYIIKIGFKERLIKVKRSFLSPSIIWKTNWLCLTGINKNSILLHLIECKWSCHSSCCRRNAFVVKR